MPLRFECNQCPAVFKSLNELTEHFETYHINKDLRTEKQLDDLRAMRDASRIKG